jgi:zinc finger MYND domain-containing protein 10
MEYLTPFEAEYLIKELEELSIRDYGSPLWFTQHSNIYRLNLQSHHNAKAREDEFIMDSMVTFAKLRPLIFNLILSETWKSRVLPLCLPEIRALPSVRSYSLVGFT